MRRFFLSLAMVFLDSTKARIKDGVIALLTANPRGLSGLEIADRLDVPSGPLYPLLRELETEKLAYHVEVPGGVARAFRPRFIYLRRLP